MVHRYHLCAAALLCTLLGLAVVLPAGALSSAPPYQTCSNVILNGGFETTGNWALGPGPLPPIYVNSPVYSGSWAMQTGSPGPTTNVANSWIYQRITIPNNAVSADLAFWVWLESAPNRRGRRSASPADDTGFHRSQPALSADCGARRPMRPPGRR